MNIFTVSRFTTGALLLRLCTQLFLDHRSGIYCSFSGFKAKLSTDICRYVDSLVGRDVVLSQILLLPTGALDTLQIKTLKLLVFVLGAGGAVTALMVETTTTSCFPIMRQSLSAHTGIECP